MHLFHFSTNSITMDEIQVIANKVLDKNNDIIKNKLKKQFIQKVFTEEELRLIDESQGNCFYEKVYNLIKGYKRTDIKEREGFSYKYLYNNKYFYNTKEFVSYLYIEENHKRASYKECFDWLYKNKGKNFLKKYKIKQEDDQKRKVININSVDEITYKVFALRNKNIKVSYLCECCGKPRICSPKTLIHFNNLLCRKCRSAKHLETSSNNQD